MCSEIFYLYRISYMYTAAIGCIVTLICGLIISAATGRHIIIIICMIYETGSVGFSWAFIAMRLGKYNLSCIMYWPCRENEKIKRSHKAYIYMYFFMQAQRIQKKLTLV